MSSKKELREILKFLVDLLPHSYSRYALNTNAMRTCQLNQIRRGLKNYLKSLGIDPSIVDRVYEIEKEIGRAKAITMLDIVSQLALATRDKEE